MTPRLIPPQPTREQLVAKAASGAAGCVEARKALQRLVNADLRKAVGRA
jgi:hypothetical protein